MTGPFLDTAAACLYLGRCREWLRLHRAAIGYCREPDGRVSYRESDLSAYKQRWYVPPPAEIGSVRRRSRGAGGSAGGLNPVTGLPWGAHLSAAMPAPSAVPAAQPRKKRRAV